MLRHASGRFWLTLTVALVATGLPGCASFKEIATYASLSAKAAGYDEVTKDYIGAIDRRKQYQPQKFQGELEAIKMRREAQSTSLDVLQQTITDYMLGLGGLASGNMRTYDKSLKNLSDNLSKATLLNNIERDSVGALSTLLVRSVTVVYLQHEIRKLIQDGNQPLQEVIIATRKIIRNGIIADLQAESVVVKRYYDNFMLAPDNPAEPVAMALAEEAKVEALGRVDKRIQSAQRYNAVLENIAQGHQYLYDHQDTIGNDKLGRQFEPYIEALRLTYRDLLDVAR
ncbi:hypothetical protein [Nitrosovibrio tenuis]|uniref:Uncharacterized protein n=1 Tax=Nitrosovibrio tenuis TaxID=1233 RepID=A0A1H7IWR3_9PROT|nr:hypothetical protein [Nitrosovibrio tenuis]SEK65245.1 hypothetical protein SAMN05216387_102280 [Nitrosovibrio tenuis]